MFKLVLQLYIVSYNLNSNEQCFVSTDASKFVPISIEIIENNNQNIDEILPNIFEQYIDLGFGWINNKIINAKKEDDKIIITYACSIPPKTILKNAYYISKNISITDNLARKSLYYV